MTEEKQLSVFQKPFTRCPECKSLKIRFEEYIKNIEIQREDIWLDNHSYESIPYATNTEHIMRAFCEDCRSSIDVTMRVHKPE